jgi:hypothetical protein
MAPLAVVLGLLAGVMFAAAVVVMVERFIPRATSCSPASRDCRRVQLSVPSMCRAR